MIINIGGDFCITPEYLSKDLFNHSIKDFFRKGDFNIVNLECPVYDGIKDTRIVKTGPHLRTDDRIFSKLQELNIHAVTLANNHILDYGKEGLESTITGLKQNDIQFVGAGGDKEQAEKPLLIEKQGLKIAFINFCENEWSVADESDAGANGMDTIDNFNQIQEARKEADFVIVIVHGGHEYYSLPSPRMQKQYRFYAENGADAVIGHHTHCISGYEYYKNIPIVYSLGNMLFTLKSTYQDWYKGLIAQLIIEKGKPIKLYLSAVIQDITADHVVLKNEIEEELFNTVSQLSSLIKDKKYLAREWENFVESRNRLLNIFSPINVLKGRFIKAVLNRFFIYKLINKVKYQKTLLNHIRCESHRDIIREIMKKKLKDENSHS